MWRKFRSWLFGMGLKGVAEGKRSLFWLRDRLHSFSYGTTDFRHCTRSEGDRQRAIAFPWLTALNPLSRTYGIRRAVIATDTLGGSCAAGSIASHREESSVLMMRKGATRHHDDCSTDAGCLCGLVPGTALGVDGNPNVSAVLDGHFRRSAMVYGLRGNADPEKEGTATVGSARGGEVSQRRLSDPDIS